MNDLLLLATLLGGPQHGYALKKQVGLITGQGEMHNNLVYPLLRRFGQNGWISKRTAAGQRGQTREVYTLTKKGKQELLRRLGDFTSKDVSSESAFRLRVGLFNVLDFDTQKRVVTERDRWLIAREQNLGRLAAAVDLDTWSGEVVRYFREETRRERRWIASLKRQIERQASHK